MKIGFTGTQKGLTPNQKTKIVNSLIEITKDLPLNERMDFHHGDCIGADEEAFDLALELGFYIIQHPPINKYKRAFTDADEIREPKPYLERNHAIVDETDILIACPGETTEQLRSGTWATVRYARKQNKKIVIIYP